MVLPYTKQTLIIGYCSGFVFTLLMLVGARFTYANLYFTRIRPESINLKVLTLLNSTPNKQKLYMAWLLVTYHLLHDC